MQRWAPTKRLEPRFITAEHWRLHQLFPDEISRADQPFTDLVCESSRGARPRVLHPPTDPEHDAWFVIKLVMAVFHHYTFAGADPDAEGSAEPLGVLPCRARWRHKLNKH